MDQELIRLMEADTPKLNPTLVNGMASEELNQRIGKHTKAELYVDAVFRSAARSFPPGLEYIGFDRCTPLEEYNHITRKDLKASKSSLSAAKKVKLEVQTARSDVYMTKFYFSFQGKQLPPKYLMLPFVLDGGTIHLEGSLFNISPVLIDRVISIGVTSVFVRLLKARLVFKRIPHHFVMNDQPTTAPVHFSRIYNRKEGKVRAAVVGHTTLLHYLLCKYGFDETFRMFGHCQPVIGGLEISRQSYPENEWTICTSAHMKPRGLSKNQWTPSPLRIAIRKTEFTPMVRSMVAAFFYIVDHFPKRLLPEYVNATLTWRVLLGLFIFPAGGEGKIQDTMNRHMEWLDEYIDSFTLDGMKKIGLDITDVYQLFALVIEKFDQWRLADPTRVASMYDKELNVLYYVFGDFIKAIHNLCFRLRRPRKKNRPLQLEDVRASINDTLRDDLILRAKPPYHGEFASVMYPGDNKAFKVTARLVSQNKATIAEPKSDNKNKKNKKKMEKNFEMPAVHPTTQLHASQAEVGSYLTMSRNAPDGRTRINHFLQYDDTGWILRNEKYRELLDDAQQKIKMKGLSAESGVSYPVIDWAFHD